jgi:3-dehydroquinate synthase
VVVAGAEAATSEKSRLFYIDDTWKTTPPDDQPMAVPSDATLSDATLTTSTYADGAKEWEIASPITFQYRVRESADVFALDSDVLLFGHLTTAEDLIRAKTRELKRVVVVDDNVYALYGERIDAYFAHHGVQVKLLVLKTNEENKNIEMALQIAEAVHELGIDRRLDPVIAIGGGVCMDIVGFAASIYRRRTPYIRVPTTLMGYVDASVGAKSGVNFLGKKNKLGAYLPPALALLDRSFLTSLDARQLSNGAAEIMKMAMVKNVELFSLLERHGPALIEHKFQNLPAAEGGAAAPSRVLKLAIHTMLEELAPNLWEDSLERLVDFGHVFSMELEMAVLHTEKLYHGEAVAIDMAFCTVLAYVRGQISAEYRDRLLATMRGLGLPVYHAEFDEAMVDEALYERVKFSSGQKIPLPTAVGEARLFNDISMDQCREALALWPTLV